MKDWEKVLVSSETPVRRIIELLNVTARQIVLVVGADRTLLGTITDGDIRRGILNGISIDHQAELFMNKHPKTASHRTKKSKNLQDLAKYKLRHLPIVNEARQVVGLESFEELIADDQLNNTVVVMAGGLGRRMSPMTDNCPKPMLTVGGKPILEIILNQCIKSGLQNFHFAVNYKAEMIESHFGDGSKWNAKIQYIREKELLGTAGALGLLTEDLRGPLIVLNGDVLTNLNFRQMLDFHHDNSSKLTMAIREYDFQVPFGVVKLKDRHILGIDEKPVHKFFVNAGIYILEPSALTLIAKDKYLDMPMLIEKLIAEGEQPVAFPLREHWMDLGRKSDFDRANFDAERDQGGLS